jgi:membrane-associated phospholipid phosphatase
MDPGINTAFQNFSVPLTSFFVSWLFLDTMPWYFLVISVITLGLHPRFGVRLITLFGINDGFNEAFKLVFHMPRPYWVSESVTAYSAHSSFGFPSGAAMYGVVLYGYIVTVVRRFRVYILCGILLLLACLARIFAGIHFMLDIFGGLFFGIIILVLFLLVWPTVEEYAARLSLPGRLVLFAVISAVPLLLVYPAFLSLGSWQLPGAWADLALLQTGSAINPARVQYAFGSAGLIFGALTGYEFLSYRGGWNPPEDGKQRATVVIAGTLSVLLIAALLTVLAETLGIDAFSEHLADFLGMAGTTFWLVAVVPSLAIQLGFQQKKESSTTAKSRIRKSQEA